MKTLTFLLLLAVCTALPASARNPRSQREPIATRETLDETPAAAPVLGTDEENGQTAAGQSAEEATQPTPRTRTDDLTLGLTAEQADSLVAEWRERQRSHSFNDFVNTYISFDNAPRSNVPDSVYTKRLLALVSPVQLPYNQIVRSYIDRYVEPGRSDVARILGMSQYYFPFIEEELIKAGLPVELRALPIIESALLPAVISRAGAAGLWQFMPSTGRSYGLEVNSLVDERCDPIRSTQAAIRYLKDLYRIYKEWSLAIAAYNCGPGAVNKALRRAGGTPDTQDYWSIYYYLSPETRGYVPMFIAANYVMNYYDKHNIGPVLPTKPLVMDTVHVAERIHFDQISNVLDIPVEELRVLNPQFRADIIPGNNERSYTLILPSRQVQAYLMSEEEIRDYNADKYARRVVAEPGSEPDAQLAAVIAQEDAEELANEEHDQAKDLPAPRKTEEVAVTRDRRGSQQQHLDTGTADAQADAASDYRAARQSARRQSKSTYEASAAQSRQTAAKSSKTTARKKKAQPAAPKSHTVKSGDNLSNIAKKYGTTVAALKKANGITGSGDALQPGDKLKLPGKSTVSKSKSKNKSKGTSSKSRKKKRRR